jgi:hypothetical protein
MLKNDVKVRGLMGFALKGLCLLALNFGQCAVSKEVRNREALHHLDLRPWESSSWCDMCRVSVVVMMHMVLVLTVVFWSSSGGLFAVL